MISYSVASPSIGIIVKYELGLDTVKYIEWAIPIDHIFYNILLPSLSELQLFDTNINFVKHKVIMLLRHNDLIARIKLFIPSKKSIMFVSIWFKVAYPHWIYEWETPYCFVYFRDHQMRYAVTLDIKPCHGENVEIRVWIYQWERRITFHTCAYRSRR